MTKIDIFITKKQLAQQLGVSPNTISDYIALLNLKNKALKSINKSIRGWEFKPREQAFSPNSCAVISVFKELTKVSREFAIKNIDKTMEDYFNGCPKV